MEVFLTRQPLFLNSSSLLHARGGVSVKERCPLSLLASSPRSWRCFSMAIVGGEGIEVFSTLVEVFP